MPHERQFFRGAKVIAAQDGIRKAVGRPIEYETYSDPNWSRAVGYWLKLARGCADEALRDMNRDIRVMINHNSDLAVARDCPSKGISSVHHQVDENGVYIECTPVDTVDGRDLLTKIDAGVIDGMSFGFYVSDSHWDDEHEGMPVRTVTKISVIDDWSFVTYPKFPATSAGVKAMCGYVPDIPEELVKPPEKKNLSGQYDYYKRRFDLLGRKG